MVRSRQYGRYSPAYGDGKNNKKGLAHFFENFYVNLWLQLSWCGLYNKASNIVKYGIKNTIKRYSILSCSWNICMSKRCLVNLHWAQGLFIVLLPPSGVLALRIIIHVTHGQCNNQTCVNMRKLLFSSQFWYILFFNYRLHFENFTNVHLVYGFCVNLHKKFWMYILKCVFLNLFSHYCVSTIFNTRTKPISSMLWKQLLIRNICFVDTYRQTNRKNILLGRMFIC